MKVGDTGFVQNNWRKDVIEPVTIISEYIDLECCLADKPLEYWNVRYDNYGFYSVHLKNEVYKRRKIIIENVQDVTSLGQISKEEILLESEKYEPENYKPLENIDKVGD